MRPLDGLESRAVRSAVLVTLLGMFGGVSPAAAGQFELGARLGVIAVPFGNAVAGEPIRDTTPVMIPFQLDAGIRLSPTLFFGIFGRLGVATSNASHEPQCYQCVGHVLTLGAEVLAHLAPTASLDPWLGLGLGIELPANLYKSGSSPDEPVFRQTSGPLLELQAGLDWPIGEHGAIGPWVGVAAGVYTERFEGLEEQPNALKTDLSAGVHFWVAAGLRLAVRF